MHMYSKGSLGRTEPELVISFTDEKTEAQIKKSLRQTTPVSIP